MKFTNLGNIDKGRENLGREMPVSMYRLFQYKMRDVLEEKYGENEAIKIFRESGKEAGIIFVGEVLDCSLDFSGFVAQLQEKLKDYKVGILRVEKFEEDTGEAVLTVAEDLDCSGLEVTGKVMCHYDEGFIEGILSEYTKKPYQVTEVDCWGTGARVCRFEAIVK
ncbi:MAG: V4R domain-containing protein [Eubacterium sp.]